MARSNKIYLLFSDHYAKKEYKIRKKYSDNMEHPKEKIKEASSDVNANTSNIEENQDKAGEEEKRVTNIFKSQKRCKNWPNCKKDNCEFHHPKETVIIILNQCLFFPKCQFGNSCLKIHPNVPCKYGFYCTRINCSYSHSSGYNPPAYQNYMPSGMGYLPNQKFKNLKLDNTKKDAITLADNKDVTNLNDNIEGSTQQQLVK